MIASNRLETKRNQLINRFRIWSILCSELFKGYDCKIEILEWIIFRVLFKLRIFKFFTESSIVSDFDHIQSCIFTEQSNCFIRCVEVELERCANILINLLEIGSICISLCFIDSLKINEILGRWDHINYFSTDWESEWFNACVVFKSSN